MIFQNYLLPLRSYLFMGDMKDAFIIPLNGLKQGRTRFSWKAGAEFFRNFDNKDIKDAEILVDVEVEKSSTYLGIDAEVSGNLTVACDRCGADVSLPVRSRISQSIKFGTEPVSGEEIVVSEEDERETVYLPEDGGELDMSQTVYDFACLALPMKKVHPDGECDPVALRFLSGEDFVPEERNEDKAESPFAVLKGLFDEENGL